MIKSILKHTIFIVILVGAGYYYWSTRPITHGPGEVATSLPSHKVSYGMETISHNGFEITPLAQFSITARVLSKQRYYYDRASDIAPYDFVLGWGPMSDERNLNHILIKQSDRKFSWEFTKPPIPVHEMRKYATNMHLIPSTLEIKEKMDQVRVGHVVEIQGSLVRIISPEGWKMESPIPKQNKNLGAEEDEVVWIEYFHIRPR